MITRSAPEDRRGTQPNWNILKGLLRGPFTIVWFVLIAATLLSWYLGSDHGVHDHRVTTVVIMLVAFIKVRFVGLYFMELRDAPTPLRIMFEAHCAIVCSAVLIVYLIGPLAPQ
jgi:heme/copper-type cytochrome/quinol oxidase subunit 4